MLPVEVGVAAEHLLVHILDLGVEAGGEAGGFAAPVVLGVLGRDFRGRREGRGGGEVVGGEEFGVLDFAVDPGLDVFDVDGGGEVDRVTVDVDPGVGGSVAGSLARWLTQLLPRVMTYGPAVMAGQLCSLHVGFPVVRSHSCMHLSMPLKMRFCSTTVRTSQQKR